MPFLFHFESKSKNERQQEQATTAAAKTTTTTNVQVITISVQAMECARQQKTQLTVSVYIFYVDRNTRTYKHDLYPLHVEREKEARRKGKEARQKSSKQKK